MFRRLITLFLVFVFVVVALPTFVVFGFSRTFLDVNFYTETVIPPAYELLVNVVAYNIYQKDAIIQKYFKEEDIRKIVSESITVDMFKISMNNFADDLTKIKDHPEHPLTFDLKPYRSGLVKIAQRLAIHLFQALPACKSDELPQFNEEGIATCVPKGTNYDVVAGPLSKQFELNVANALPDNIDLNTLTLAKIEELIANYSKYKKAEKKKDTAATGEKTDVKTGGVKKVPTKKKSKEKSKEKPKKESVKNPKKNNKA